MSRSQRPLRHALALMGIGALALAALAPAREAAADLLLTTETRDPAAGPDAGRRARIWLGEAGMRMEFVGGGALGQGTTVVFRPDPGVYQIVDASTRSFVQIDRETMERLGERVRATRREMTAQLERMTPAQRTQAEAMLAQMAPPATPPKRESLRATKERKRIDDHDAKRSELVLDERVVGDVYTVPLETLDLERAELAPFAQLAAFQRALLTSLGQSAQADFANAPFEIFEQADGFPLLLRRLHEGSVESETHFSAPQHVDDDPSRYTIPADYRRRLGPGDATPPG